jgi:hypothetical protein
VRGLFPLTPALSPKERVNRFPSLDNPARLEFAHARSVELPLPQGEGGGEGERAAGIYQARRLRNLFAKVEFEAALLNYAPWQS